MLLFIKKENTNCKQAKGKEDQINQTKQKNKELKKQTHSLTHSLALLGKPKPAASSSVRVYVRVGAWVRAVELLLSCCYFVVDNSPQQITKQTPSSNKNTKQQQKPNHKNRGGKLGCCLALTSGPNTFRLNFQKRKVERVCVSVCVRVG